MTPLRWLSALCLVVCGWCAGDSIYARVQAHLEALQNTIALLEILQQEIGFRHSDLELLRQKLLHENRIPPDTPALVQLLPFPQLTQAEKLWFSECFSGLGHAEAEAECRRLELYLERFRRALQDSQAKAKTQAELSHKLGLAAGFAAAILLG